MDDARENAITDTCTAIQVIEETMGHLETVKALKEGNLAVLGAVTGDDPPDGTARRHAWVMVRQMHREAERAIAAGRECVNALNAYLEVL